MVPKSPLSTSLFRSTPSLPRGFTRIFWNEERGLGFVLYEDVGRDVGRENHVTMVKGPHLARHLTELGSLKTYKY